MLRAILQDQGWYDTAGPVMPPPVQEAINGWMWSLNRHGYATTGEPDIAALICENPRFIEVDDSRGRGHYWDYRQDDPWDLIARTPERK